MQVLLDPCEYTGLPKIAKLNILEEEKRPSQSATTSQIFYTPLLYSSLVGFVAIKIFMVAY